MPPQQQKFAQITAHGKGQLASQSSVNICKFTSCQIHYSLFTQRARPLLNRKSTVEYFQQRRRCSNSRNSLRGLTHPQHQLLSVFRYGDTSIFDGILFAQGIVDKVHIKAFMRDYCILALQAAKIQEARMTGVVLIFSEHF